MVSALNRSGKIKKHQLRDTVRAEMVGPTTDEKLENEHRMVRSGQEASCTCGTWECRTNEVVETDMLKILQKQYSLHLQDQGNL